VTAGCTIGLTGDVGSGKSTVREWLAGQGAATLDADAEVHALLARDRHVVEAVAARFGPAVRAASGIDRKALAATVFADAAALADLEGILHPAVIASTRSWLEAAEAEMAVVEAVRLVESGAHDDFDYVWLVACDADERRRRLLERGWSAEEIGRRMSAATPLAPKLALADVIIDNSGTCRATVRQLEFAFGRARMSVERGPGKC